jgi:hypothetical protein
MDLLARLSAPGMKLLGLPRDASHLWIAIDLPGYAYVSGLIGGQLREGGMKSREADLFGHPGGLCHSSAEVGCQLFVLRLPRFWITVPRPILAPIAVCMGRARRRFVHRFSRVRTAEALVSKRLYPSAYLLPFPLA